jgi:hypothetical protein
VTLTEFYALHSDRDRRRGARYPLRLTLKFSAVTPPICSGDGETLNISSKGLLFTTKESLAIGQRLQVSLDWPASLDNIPLRLVVSGEILRSGDGQSAMTIEKYEFRIRGKEPSAKTVGMLQSRRNPLRKPGLVPLFHILTATYQARERVPRWEWYRGDGPGGVQSHRSLLPATRRGMRGVALYRKHPDGTASTLTQDRRAEGLSMG